MKIAYIRVYSSQHFLLWCARWNLSLVYWPTYSLRHLLTDSPMTDNIGLKLEISSFSWNVSAENEKIRRTKNSCERCSPFRHCVDSFFFLPNSRTQYTFQRDERVWHYSHVVFVTMTTSPLHENERIIFAKEINVFLHVRSRARWAYCEFQNTYANTSTSLQNIICQKCPCDLRTMYEQWNDPMGFLQKVYSVAST